MSLVPTNYTHDSPPLSIIKLITPQLHAKLFNTSITYNTYTMYMYNTLYAVTLNYVSNIQGSSTVQI